MSQETFTSARLTRGQLIERNVSEGKQQSQGQTKHGILRVLTVSAASALSQVEQFLQAALTQCNPFHIFTASRPSTAHLHQYPAAGVITLSTKAESTHRILRWLKNGYKS